jgi:hypothetical protein
MAFLNTYDTIKLQGVIAEMDSFTPYLTSFFCGQTFFFDTEEIAFDKMFEGNTLAPYVSPLVAGKVNAKSGSNVMKFKVPYIKDLDQVTPADGVKRRVGEGFGGTSTPQQRIAAERVRLIGRHDKRLSLRIEEQVSQLINRGGKVLCEGEGHPSIEVDYQMSAANNITVTGAARWSQLDPNTDSGQEILDDLEDWSANSNTSVGRATFEKSVWKHIIKFKAVRELRDTQVRGESSTFSTAPNTNNEDLQYKGTLGTLNCYVYTGFYRDSDESTATKRPFLDVGRVVLSSERPQGAVAYGAIQDVQEMRAVRQFSKNWISQDPSAENLMSQSAPLATLADIDSIVTIQTDGGA